MAILRRLTYTIPAGGVLNNALQGLSVEFVGKASVVRLFGVADVAGDTMSLTRTTGGDSQVLVDAGSPLNGAAAAGQGPKLDEDFIGEWPVPAGSHLVLGVVGTAAHVGRFAVELTP